MGWLDQLGAMGHQMAGPIQMGNYYTSPIDAQRSAMQSDIDAFIGLGRSINHNAYAQAFAAEMAAARATKEMKMYRPVGHDCHGCGAPLKLHASQCAYCLRITGAHSTDRRHDVGYTDWRNLYGEPGK